jgi:hypothetical protein
MLQVINPFKKKRLESLLNESKTVKIQGITFEISRIDVTSHLSGAKTLRKYYDTYEGKIADDKKRSSIDETKLYKETKEHFTDVFLASVISPKLKRDEKTEDGVLISKMFTNWPLCNELYDSIIFYSNGKKK